jgi:hypothetical protein
MLQRKGLEKLPQDSMKQSTYTNCCISVIFFFFKSHASTAKEFFVHMTNLVKGWGALGWDWGALDKVGRLQNWGGGRSSWLPVLRLHEAMCGCFYHVESWRRVKKMVWSALGRDVINRQATTCWIDAWGRDLPCLPLLCSEVIHHQNSWEQSIFVIVFVHMLGLISAFVPEDEFFQAQLHWGRTCSVFISMLALRGKEAGWGERPRNIVLNAWLPKTCQLAKEWWLAWWTVNSAPSPVFLPELRLWLGKVSSALSVAVMVLGGWWE